MSTSSRYLKYSKYYSVISKYSKVLSKRRQCLKKVSFELVVNQLRAAEKNICYLHVYILWVHFLLIKMMFYSLKINIITTITILV